MKRDFYEEVTNKIVAELEKGVAPWVNDMALPNAHPYNCVTGRQYSGINTLILWLAKEKHGFSADCWLTFKQAQSLGFSVRKGEKGTRICFVKPVEKKHDDSPSDTESEDGEPIKLIPIMRSYTVFNLDQLSGDLQEIEALKSKHSKYRDELSSTEVESFASKIGAKIDFEGNIPCYSSFLDKVSMPPIEYCFDSSISKVEAESIYLSTALHEFVHWTGHQKRLNRELHRFDKEAYAMEELVAELGSSFLCACFNVKGNLQHANYIGSWLKVLKNDKRAIFHASSQAQQSVNYILALYNNSGMTLQKAA